jgi:hypothetical protein
MGRAWFELNRKRSEVHARYLLVESVGFSYIVGCSSASMAESYKRPSTVGHSSRRPPANHAL